MGTRGYSATTDYLVSTDDGLTPAGTLTDPFPYGIEQPQGSGGGLMTGAGSEIEYVDQYSKSSYVQQYSIGIERELPGAAAVSIGYLGSRTDNISVWRNIN